MILATAEESLKIDALAPRETGRSAEDFMEQAGTGIAQKLISRNLIHPKQKISILCGPGNNGGDGFVIARELLNRNFTNVQVFYFMLSSGSELWHEEFSRLFIQGHEPIKIEKTQDWDLKDSEVIVDALFGVGLNRPLGSPWTDIVEKINQNANALVISVDTPSGLHANRGIPFPVAVKADVTVACQFVKPGFLIEQGPSFVGKLLKVSLDYPQALCLREARSVRWLGKNLIPKLFPRRSQGTNKSKQGHLLVIAGSSGMVGALRLCAEAASRLGVGYISICTRAKAAELQSLPADFLSLSLQDFFKSDLQKYSAVVVGPGLGIHSETKKILEHLIKNPRPTLVDADALTVVTKNQLFPLPATWLVTPHAGELSRLLGIPARELEENRLDAVERGFQKLKCQILFKGFRTIVFNSKQKYIIGTGNSALAKAGTGDVLAGFIGSLLAQGLCTDEAAILGSLIHGALADQWVKEGRGNFSLMASDLIYLANLVDD